MQLSQVQMRSLATTARVAHLATLTSADRPHIVPIVFVIDGAHLMTAIDQKPKRTRDLQRIRNIERTPAISVLIDHYDEDWRRLWWVQLEGTARVLRDSAQIRRPIALLSAKYAQHAADPPAGPVIDMTIDTWRGWAAGEI